jgi:predicted acyltransferase (DUF342 family)
MPRIAKKLKPVLKQVFCTHCGQPSEVGDKAISVVCRHCNKRLITENLKVANYHAVREFATCGDIVVEKNGQVVALVKAANLTVRGKVKGNVIARRCVTIGKTGQLQGDIQAFAVNIENGASYDGYVRIGAPS